MKLLSTVSDQNHILVYTTSFQQTRVLVCTFWRTLNLALLNLLHQRIAHDSVLCHVKLLPHNIMVRNEEVLEKLRNY